MKRSQSLALSILIIASLGAIIFLISVAFVSSGLGKEIKKINQIKENVRKNVLKCESPVVGGKCLIKCQKNMVHLSEYDESCKINDGDFVTGICCR